MTIPGILLHYALRKRCIRALVRTALLKGAAQVVTLGAGFDPLSYELHEDFRNVRFWEIDHPTTQRHKLRALRKIDSKRLHFIALDLNAAVRDGKALIDSGFDPAQPVFWIAEGLLIYLPPDVVSQLMKTLKNLSAPGSQFVFTFMEKQRDGRIGFDSQSKLVDWWLRRRAEPFLWGTARSELVELVRPWRVVRFFDNNALRDMEPGLVNQCIAKGEVICLAEI